MNPDLSAPGARMGRLSSHDAHRRDSALGSDSAAGPASTRGDSQAPVSRMPDLPPDFGPVRAPANAERLRVRFSGRGGEYFRIWIVNLLLMLLTLGIYYPWAKVRKLRYFHGHTQVGGHALDFHGDPRKMLRGTLLMGLLFVLYSVAGEVSPTAGGVALLIIASIWPALWRASLQFRFAHTSWRGLRLGFLGEMKAAYRALGLPLMAILVLSGGGAALSVALAPPPGRAGGGAGLIALAPLGVGFLAAMALLPWMWFGIKRFQQAHLAYGSVRTEFRGTLKSVYGVFLRTALVGLPVLLVLGVGVGLWTYFMRRGDPRTAMNLLPLLMIGAFMAQLAPQAYFTSRLQNLVWSRTGNRVLRFKSELAFLPLWGLMMKNTLLVVLTLGLYWPWAAIALARRRLESVTLVTRVSLDHIAAAASQRQPGDAAGDAAADLFGVDFGL